MKHKEKRRKVVGMKKKLILMLCCLMFISTTLVCADDESLVMNIEKLQDFALENNIQGEIDKLNIDAKESEHKDVVIEGNKIGTVFTPTAMVNKKIKQQVSSMEAETAIEIAKREKEENAKDLKLDIYKQSIDILYTKKQLKIENSKLEILNEKYEMVKSKKKLGNITANDLMDEEYKVENQKIDIENLKNSIKTKEMKLKNLLGLEPNSAPVEIQEELIKRQFRPVDIDKTVSKVMDSDLSVFKEAQKLKAKQKAMEITKEYLKYGDIEYDQAMVALKTAEMDYKDARLNLKVNVKNKYNELLDSKDKLDLAKKNIEIKEKQLDDIKIKYDNGMASYEDVLTSKENLLNANLEYYKAIRDYNIRMAEFDRIREF